MVDRSYTIDRGERAPYLLVVNDGSVFSMWNPSRGVECLEIMSGMLVRVGNDSEQAEILLDTRR